MTWDWDLDAGDLTHFNIPAVALWLSPSMSRLLGPLRDEVGPELYSLLIAYHSGLGTGEDYHKIVTELGETFELGFAAWGEAVSSAGWGKFTLEDFSREDKRATVRVDNPWELALDGADQSWSCPFLNGKLTGIFSHALDVTCWAEEETVIDNEQRYVRFSIAPSETTFEIELNRLRHTRLQESERALSAEIERKTADLRAAREDQKAVLASLSELLITVGLDDTIERYMVPADQESNFPDAMGAIGRQIHDVFGPAFADLFENVENQAPAPYSLGFAQTVGQRERSYDARVSLRRGPEGTVNGLTLVVRDVTEQRQIERQLAHRERMESVGQLAGGVAHDFNNTLAAILGAADLLKTRLGGEHADLVDTIINASTSSADMIRGLINFSRERKSDSNRFDLHATLDRVVGLLENSVDRRIVLQRDFLAETMRLRGDASQLQSALLNLGINACNAMPDGGTLRFSTRTVCVEQPRRFDISGMTVDDGNYTAIEIADTGNGMGPKTLQRIFEPFFSTRNNGTGLGLVGVRRTVRRHAGAIDVRSAPGEGTVFTLYLPVDPTTAADFHEQESLGVSDQPVVHGKILLVDDDPLLRKIGQRVLTRFCDGVVSASNGQQALERYHEAADEIALVIMDVNMPLMDGIDATDQLKALNPTLPVILTTGYSSGDLARSAGQPLLRKPYLIRELAAAIERALAN